MDWRWKQKNSSLPSLKHFPDLRRNIADMVAEGDKVAISVNVTGCLQRRVPGYTDDWQAGIFHCDGHSNFLIEGKIAERVGNCRHDGIDAADWSNTRTFC